MKKILGAVLAACLVACNGGGGGVGGPPPTPTPGPTSTPSSCGSAAAPMYHVGPPKITVPFTKGAQPASNADLAYGGGPVLLQPEVYLDLWGYPENDPVAQRLAQLYLNVGKSVWFNTVTQYCQNNPEGYIKNEPGMFGGEWSDTLYPVPNHPTQEQLAAEAVIAAQHFGISDTDNVTIVVATPTGKSMVGFGTHFCGWHDSTGYNNGDDLSYEYIPYMPDAGSGCGAGLVNKPGTLDGVTIVAGHELAESTTDPLPLTGWVQPGTSQEIADLCAWTNLQNVSLNGVSLPMQPLFSNSSGQCEQ